MSDPAAVSVPEPDIIPASVCAAVAAAGSNLDADRDPDEENGEAASGSVPMGDDAEDASKAAPSGSVFASATAPAAARTDAAPAAAPAAASLPDPLATTDPTDPARAAGAAHARLVFGEDDQRVVVSVALRHGTVDVAIRAADPALAQTIARTHDQLEQALRGHGLALGDLSSHDHRDGDRAAPAAPLGRLAASEPAAAASTATPIDPRLRALA